MIALKVPAGVTAVSVGPSNYEPDADGIVLASPGDAFDLIALGCTPATITKAAKADKKGT